MGRHTLLADSLRGRAPEPTSFVRHLELPGNDCIAFRPATTFRAEIQPRHSVVSLRRTDARPAQGRRIVLRIGYS